MAGLEAEKTNIFLQSLATAATSKPGASGKAAKPAVKKAPSKKPIAGTSKGDERKVSPKPVAKEPVSKVAAKEETAKEEKVAKDETNENAEEKSFPEKKMESEKVAEAVEAEKILSPKPTVRPPTSKKVKKVLEEEPPNDRPKTAGRPKTARAAPPRIKVDVEEAPSADALASQLSTGQNDGQGSNQSSAVRRPVAVIVDNGNETMDDEEDTAVMIQTDDGTSSRSGRASALGGDIESGLYGNNDGNIFGNSLTAGQEKGSLVQKLIETKKDFEGDDAADDNGGTMDAVSALDSVNIEKIRSNIQSLAKLSVPVGKLFDYLHEDIDSMLNELRFWNEEVTKSGTINQERMDKEKIEEEQLKKELEQLENEINEEMERISVTKGNIERNDEKLRKMMMIVTDK